MVSMPSLGAPNFGVRGIRGLLTRNNVDIKVGRFRIPLDADAAIRTRGHPRGRSVDDNPGNKELHGLIDDL